MKKILFFILGLFVSTNFVQGQQKLKAIKAGRVVDVINGKVLINQIILINSDTIVSMGASISIPVDAEIIDLSILRVGE